MSRRRRKNSGNDSHREDSKTQPDKPKSKKGPKTKMEGSSKAKGAGVKTDEFEFFYSNKSPFSQHYPVTFNIDGVTFNCAEQYMMYQKAVIFKDNMYADLIMKTDKPAQQKKYGRKVRDFDPVVWKRESIKVVERGNLAKFGQNPDIKAIMIETHPRELVEASPRDRLWGIGLGMNNPKAQNKENWRGRNQLGIILTRVRETLMEELGTGSEGSSIFVDRSGKSSKRDEETEVPKSKVVKGKKREYEKDDKEVCSHKKQKTSDHTKKTKGERNEEDYEWVEQTIENIGNKSRSGEESPKILKIEQKDRKSSEETDSDEIKKRKKREKKKEKRKKSKERKREEKRKGK